MDEQEKLYDLPDFEGAISAEDLSKLEAAQQIEVMKTWFFQNYEDPAERTPYESKEGGYIWIYGGPYEAGEELDSEFAGIVPDDVIEELSGELENLCWQWTATEQPGDYDDYVVSMLASISDVYHNFSGAILDIEKLLEVEVDGAIQQPLYQMLYARVITALEAYLSDTFIRHVFASSDNVADFVKSSPDFQKEKVTLAEVLDKANKIENIVKEHLGEIVWHNLGKIKPMYKQTLGVEFPEAGDVYRAILKRHDIVHRGGKNQGGEDIFISKQDVLDLISKVEAFVQAVDSQLPDQGNEEF